jgi:hypothetical protein
MCSYLVKNGQNLIRSLDNVSFSDMGKELKVAETLVQENTSQGTGVSTSRVKEHHTIATNRPRRTIRPPTRHGFEDMISYTLVISNKDPTTFQEAVNSQEKNKWVGDMAEEMESLHKNQT